MFANDYFNKIVYHQIPVKKGKRLKKEDKYELLYLFWWIHGKINGLSSKFLDHSYRLFPDLGFFIPHNYYAEFIDQST